MIENNNSYTRRELLLTGLFAFVAGFAANAGLGEVRLRKPPTGQGDQLWQPIDGLQSVDWQEFPADPAATNDPKTWTKVGVMAVRHTDLTAALLDKGTEWQPAAAFRIGETTGKFATLEHEMRLKGIKAADFIINLPNGTEAFAAGMNIGHDSLQASLGIVGPANEFQSIVHLPPIDGVDGEFTKQQIQNDRSSIPIL